MATDGGGEWPVGVTRERHIGPWSGYNFFLANLANFHVAAILAISTYIKPNMISERCTHNNGGLLIKCVSQIFPAKWKTTTNKINKKSARIIRIRQIWDTLPYFKSRMPPLTCDPYRIILTVSLLVFRCSLKAHHTIPSTGPVLFEMQSLTAQIRAPYVLAQPELYGVEYQLWIYWIPIRTCIIITIQTPYHQVQWNWKTFIWEGRTTPAAFTSSWKKRGSPMNCLQRAQV